MLHYLDASVTVLNQEWTMASVAPGTWTHPDQVDPSALIPAPVPGTAAQALTANEQFDPTAPLPLQDLDFWYQCPIVGAAGEAVLRFEGLATLANIFLNGDLVGHSESMFIAQDLPVQLTGSDQLVIHFPALSEALASKGPRARWRPRLLDNQGLRLVRTTLLGHMPGWSPTIQAVGPYRTVSLIRPGRWALDQVRIAADLSEDGTGLLVVSARNLPAGAVLHCAGQHTAFRTDGDRFVATMVIDPVDPWWPATHGTPQLYSVEVEIDQQRFSLGRTGFRHLEIGPTQDFGIRINGEDIFCRGAVWTNADLLSLPGDRSRYEPALTRLAEAGGNMVRIPGIATYETSDFFDLCDELGILVFADFMFANFDYPQADARFVAAVETEARQFLDAQQGRPSLAICCAGSEIAQQASMLGLPAERWYSSLATQALPELVAEYRPDVGYVPGSPSGGPLPFSVDVGVGHYYGVGAYQQPASDARRAAVRFAGECLAFANFSDDEDCDLDQGVPRDLGTNWDFADTRDHYVERLYGWEPTGLRVDSPQAYRDYGRAAVAEIATETFAEWRRADSRCHGALVFTLSDLAPGAGWGILDSDHRPKSIFRALSRSWRPIAIVATDEGVNGLRLHLINETAAPVIGQVELFGLRDGTVVVARAEREITVGPRSTCVVESADLYGGFFDYTYTYRFGASELNVAVARLRVGGEIVSEAFSFPVGRAAARQASHLEVEVVAQPDGWALQLVSSAFAQSIHIHVPGFSPSDDWFHLVPDDPKLIRLRSLGTTDHSTRPQGWVRALGGATITF